MSRAVMWPSSMPTSWIYSQFAALLCCKNIVVLLASDQNFPFLELEVAYVFSYVSSLLSLPLSVVSFNTEPFCS